MMKRSQDKLTGEMAGLRDQLTTDIAAEVSKSLTAAIGTLTEERAKLAQITDLERKIATLTIQKDRLVEDNAREIRETDHSTGLLRKQVEAEREQSKAEARLAADRAKLEVREENLAADKQRFSDEMSFQRQQMQGELSRIDRILSQVLDRLPDISASLNVERGDAPAAPTASSRRRAAARDED